MSFLARTTAFALCAVLFSARAAAPCDIALVLTIDVSGSIDRAEYRLQAQGLADALDDPEVAEALVAAKATLAVLQWSGAGQQKLVLPWTRILTPRDSAALARRARTMPRAFARSDTAVGEALSAAARSFDDVPECHRRVIDISGDGPQNAGRPLPGEREAALTAGAIINAIAIEDAGRGYPVSAYYERYIITRGGFVITARSLEDYPRAIRAKILREVARPTG